MTQYKQISDKQIPAAGGMTLKELRERKAELLAEIAMQRNALEDAYTQMVSPVKQTRSIWGFFGKNMLAGFSIFESALWGYRIYNRIVRMIRRFRR